jgi:uncharacterized SAM-binding protein YcdF (DUF218 family)
MIVNPLSTALLTTGVFPLLVLLGRRRGFLIAAIVVILVLWLAATPRMSHGLEFLLESRHADVAAEALPMVDAIVVLGGMLSPPVSVGGDANLSAAADRLVYAARLYAPGHGNVPERRHRCDSGGDGLRGLGAGGIPPQSLDR